MADKKLVRHVRFKSTEGTRIAKAMEEFNQIQMEQGRALSGMLGTMIGLTEKVDSLIQVVQALQDSSEDVVSKLHRRIQMIGEAPGMAEGGKIKMPGRSMREMLSEHARSINGRPVVQVGRRFPRLGDDGQPLDEGDVEEAFGEDYDGMLADDIDDGVVDDDDYDAEDDPEIPF